MQNYSTSSNENYAGINSASVSYASQNDLEGIVAASPMRKEHNLNHRSPVSGCSYCGI